jgi:hypothetical protein
MLAMRQIYKKLLKKAQAEDDELPPDILENFDDYHLDAWVRYVGAEYTDCALMGGSRQRKY